MTRHLQLHCFIIISLFTFPLCSLISAQTNYAAYAHTKEEMQQAVEISKTYRLAQQNLRKTEEELKQSDWTYYIAYHKNRFDNPPNRKKSQERYEKFLNDYLDKQPDRKRAQQLVEEIKKRIELSTISRAVQYRDSAAIIGWYLKQPDNPHAVGLTLEGKTDSEVAAEYVVLHKDQFQQAKINIESSFKDANIPRELQGALYSQAGDQLYYPMAQAYLDQHPMPEKLKQATDQAKQAYQQYASLSAVLKEYAQAMLYSEQINTLMQAQDADIVFYGKVLDQNNDPVPDATVVMNTRHADPKGIYNMNITHFSFQTDANGQYTVKDLKGHLLYLEKIVKDGYEYEFKANPDRSFNYSPKDDKGHQPDTEKPVIFRMRKKAKSACLITGSINVRTKSNSVYYWNLVDNKRSRLPKGEDQYGRDREYFHADLYTQTTYDTEKQAVIIKLKADDTGGITEVDSTCFTAPDNGYQNEWSISINSRERIEKRLVLHSRNKQVYSLLQTTINCSVDSKTNKWYASLQVTTQSNLFGQPYLEKMTREEVDWKVQQFITAKAISNIHAGIKPALPDIEAAKQEIAEVKQRQSNKAEKNKDVPIYLRGQVIDNHDKPITDATVIYSIKHYSKDQKKNINSQTKHIKTNADGYFEIKDIKGSRIDLQDIQKDGYIQTNKRWDRSYWDYYSSTSYKTYQKKVQIFTLRQPQEPMCLSQGHLYEKYLRANRPTYFIDVIRPQMMTPLSWENHAKRWDENKATDPPYVKDLTVSAQPNAQNTGAILSFTATQGCGLITSENKYYRFPDEPVKQTHQVELEFSNKKKEFYLYVSSRNQQVYSRLKIETHAYTNTDDWGVVVDIRTMANPYGNKSLEEKQRLHKQLRVKLLTEAENQLRAGEQPQLPDLDALMKDFVPKPERPRQIGP